MSRRGLKFADAPALRLDGDAPAVESLITVMRRWMDVIDAARPALLADVDPEYLHDLRTAVRATRSMLGLAGQLFPNDTATRFAAEFEWLGRLTTPLRDLDVCLYELAGFGSMDPSGLENLDPLRNYLASERLRELGTVLAGLQSVRGEDLGAQWRRALDSVVIESAGPSTRELAVALAQQAYQRIVQAGEHVTPASPAGELHRLRRRCKHMRYLLDSFDSVYSPASHRQVVTALKNLQNCLGDIQDSDVQRRQLVKISETLARLGTPVDTVLEIGTLRGRTSLREAAARHDLDHRLRGFFGPGTRAQVEAMDVCSPEDPPQHQAAPVQRARVSP